MRLIDDIREAADDLVPLAVLLTVVAVPFLAAGWVAGFVFRAGWRVVSWCWAAVLVGFRAARGDS